MNGDQVVATTITDSEGVYEFDDVPPGDYHIQVSKLDPDQQFSPITDGGNQIDPTGASPTANIGYNDTVSTCDIGMYMPPATIGPNEVFGDLDGDGQRDPMEPPLENVTIGLYCLDENGVAVLIGTNVTDAQGKYEFDNVQPGLCYIQVDPPTDDDTGGDYVFSPINDNGNQVHPNGTTVPTEVDWNDNIDDWNVGM